MRNLDVRFDVLRNGVKITTLQPKDAPTIQFDKTAEIKTSMSGTFAQNETFDALYDEIKPYVIIDGVEHPCGIYAPATVELISAEDGKGISIEAYDRCWTVQCFCSESVLHFSAGRNYVDLIRSLLASAGIALVISTPSSATLRYDREDWDIGTSYLTIINELLSEINYQELWFNADGYAVIQPKNLLDAGNIVRTYDANNVESMMLDNTYTSMDLYDAPNVFICVCANPDGTFPLVARAENTSPISPLSIGRRGKRIARLYKVENIASLSALEDYAQLLCQQNMLLGESISITTALIPECGMDDVVALVHPDASGLCYETAWEMTMQTGGTMTHTLEKVIAT